MTLKIADRNIFWIDFIHLIFSLICCCLTLPSFILLCQQVPIKFLHKISVFFFLLLWMHIYNFSLFYPSVVCSYLSKPLYIQMQIYWYDIGWYSEATLVIEHWFQSQFVYETLVLDFGWNYDRWNVRESDFVQNKAHSIFVVFVCL